MKKPTIDAKIEEVAEAVAKDALDSDSPSFRLDALKVLTGFRVGSHKANKTPEEPDSPGTMKTMKDRILNADAPAGTNVTPLRKDS